MSAGAINTMVLIIAIFFIWTITGDNKDKSK